MKNRYSAVFYKEDDEIYCTVKGSLEVVLSFCDSMILDGKKVDEISQQTDISRNELIVQCIDYALNNINNK